MMTMSDAGCGALLRVGKVAGYTDTGLIVDVSLSGACQRCEEGRGCGMGLLARRQQQRIIVFASAPRPSLPAAYPLNSDVTIALPKRQMNYLTLLIYVIPLLLALLVAGAASLLDAREWLSVALFFSALMCSVLALKYLLRERMERFRPRLVS